MQDHSLTFFCPHFGPLGDLSSRQDPAYAAEGELGLPSVTLLHLCSSPEVLFMSQELYQISLYN